MLSKYIDERLVLLLHVARKTWDIHANRFVKYPYHLVRNGLTRLSSTLQLFLRPWNHMYLSFETDPGMRNLFADRVFYKNLFVDFVKLIENIMGKLSNTYKRFWLRKHLSKMGMLHMTGVLQLLSIYLIKICAGEKPFSAQTLTRRSNY